MKDRPWILIIDTDQDFTRELELSLTPEFNVTCLSRTEDLRPESMRRRFAVTILAEDVAELWLASAEESPCDLLLELGYWTILLGQTPECLSECQPEFVVQVERDVGVWELRRRIRELLVKIG